MSQIVQILFSERRDGLYGLDDEGIVWYLDENNKKWRPVVEEVEDPMGVVEAEVITK